MRIIKDPIEIKAIKFAYEKHKDQTDKAGLPYILHPIYVNELIDLSPVHMTPDELRSAHIAAILHDTIEDTDTSYSELLKKGFPVPAVDAVLLLTHDKTVSYDDYIKNICCSKNTIAIAVKIADLTHNLRKCSDDPAYANLAKRYRNALKTIETTCKDLLMRTT